LRRALSLRKGRFAGVNGSDGSAFEADYAAREMSPTTAPKVLEALIHRSGFRVERRFGTFASYRDLKRALTPEKLGILDDLRQYYDNEVAACIFARLYSDYSRNILWVLSIASGGPSCPSGSTGSPRAGRRGLEPAADKTTKVGGGVRHKTCTGCGRLKPITAQFFHRQAINPTGSDPRCKKCRAEHRRQQSRK
jgi:hypothetical protein